MHEALEQLKTFFTKKLQTQLKNGVKILLFDYSEATCFSSAIWEGQNQKIGVSSTPYAHFQRFMGSKIYSKNHQKNTPKHAKMLIEIVLFLLMKKTRILINLGVQNHSQNHQNVAQEGDHH